MKIHTPHLTTILITLILLVPAGSFSSLAFADMRPDPISDSLPPAPTIESINTTNESLEITGMTEPYALVQIWSETDGEFILAKANNLGEYTIQTQKTLQGEISIKATLIDGQPTAKSVQLIVPSIDTGELTPLLITNSPLSHKSNIIQTESKTFPTLIILGGGIFILGAKILFYRKEKL